MSSAKKMNTCEVILGIETSCDETAAAVVGGGKQIFSSVVSSQVELHGVFGGVVPEVASRAHIEMLLPVLEQALSGAPKPEAVAVTSGPGLAGALLVGSSAAKALALAWDVPFAAVNHLEAHLYAALLDEPDLKLPIVVLLVSGGHTLLVLMRDHGDYEVLGQTRDDAAGEAFDKTARALGLGYPGGPLIDDLSQKGDPASVELPRPMISNGLDFSFSGLKTAVVNYLRSNPNADTACVAASFQASVVDVLEAKAMRALAQTKAKGLCLAGGVGANTLLRSRLSLACEDAGLDCYLASREMCTDNAAMVAAAGWWQLNKSGASGLDSPVLPAARLGSSPQ